MITAKILAVAAWISQPQHTAPASTLPAGQGLFPAAPPHAKVMAVLQGESFGKACGSSTSKALGNQQSQAHTKAEALGTRAASSASV